MITEKDLQEAIAECLGDRSPNANTCIKLAAYYIIQNELYSTEKQKQVVTVERGQSFDAPPVMINSESEFAQIINRLPSEAAWAVMDDLMNTLKVINPRLYAGVMRKLAD